MSQLDVASGEIVAYAGESARSRFIKNTYLHTAAAIGIFALVEAILIRSGIAEGFMQVLGASQWSWLIVLAVFMGVGYIANSWAHSGLSRPLQYAGLGLFILAEAIIFMPLVYIAQAKAPDVLQHAAIVTAALVAGISYTAFSTRKNFSFLAPALSIGGIVAIGVIIASIVFGFTLGLFFSAAMIVFAGAAILYTTSNIIHEYHTEQHVAASLALFSGIALLFWYVVQFMLSFMDE